MPRWWWQLTGYETHIQNTHAIPCELCHCKQLDTRLCLIIWINWFTIHVIVSHTYMMLTLVGEVVSRFFVDSLWPKHKDKYGLSHANLTSTCWIFTNFTQISVRISLLIKPPYENLYFSYQTGVWNSIVQYNIESSWSIVMPNGDTDHGQHQLRQWLSAWWHQAITCNNVE